MTRGRKVKKEMNRLTEDDSQASMSNQAARLNLAEETIIVEDSIMADDTPRDSLVDTTEDNLHQLNHNAHGLMTPGSSFAINNGTMGANANATAFGTC